MENLDRDAELFAAHVNASLLEMVWLIGCRMGALTSWPIDEELAAVDRLLALNLKSPTDYYAQVWLDMGGDPVRRQLLVRSVFSAPFGEWMKAINSDEVAVVALLATVHIWGRVALGWSLPYARVVAERAWPGVVLNRKVDRHLRISTKAIAAELGIGWQGSYSGGSGLVLLEGGDR